MARRFRHLSPTTFTLLLICLFGGGLLLSVNAPMFTVSAEGNIGAAQPEQPIGTGTLSAEEANALNPDATLIFVTFGPSPTRTPTPVNIGNFVWDDYDQDGRQDAGEPGLSGVTVQLWNSAKSALISQTTTNGSGNYTVVAPTPGNYRIRVLLSGSDTFSPKNQAGGDDQLDSDINTGGADAGFTDTFNIASNVISTTIHDAGIIKYRTPTPTRTPTSVNIGNFVWDDLDQDGRQDAGEPGLSGVTVQLWNSAKSQLISQTVSNGSGGYTVVAPTPGNYRIRVLLSGSDTFSPKNQAGGDDQLDSDINPSGANAGFTDTFNIASNVISTTIHDAGIIRYHAPTPTRTPTPVNIGNFVWNDLNANGIQDGGEPGLAGVTVQLWNSTKSVMLYTTVTDANGIYSVFTPGGAGTYYVRVLLPTSNDSFSPKDQGSDLTDSDVTYNLDGSGFTDAIITASNTISITTVDAGIVKFTTPPTADTLALYGSVANKFSLVNTLADKPAPTAYTNYFSNAPIVGKFVMGDWNNDGQETPGLYGGGGYFWYTNQLGTGATWTSVFVGKYKKAAVVAGRFMPAYANDCFGVVHLTHGTGAAGFPIYYVCDLALGTVQQIWLNAEISQTGKYQVVAGDFNNDGIDTLAVRRGATFLWTDTALGLTDPATFPNTANFGDPYDGYGLAVAGDWDGNGFDSFGLVFIVEKNARFFWRNDISPLNLPHLRQRLKSKVNLYPQVFGWDAPDTSRAAEESQPLPPPDVLDIPAFHVTATATPDYLGGGYATQTPTLFLPTSTPTEIVPSQPPSNTPLPTFMPTATQVPQG